ncbi:uncharacterized protein TNCV_4396641 [Trichonephila clavipes]|uniref:Uncharacterized protein n=1 Tax=Trichonephila clavipes TaxID=2585209 RepID=A0A8X6W5E3_TRICX|nr:uncharacterized protein TNCV_4396641 [Trichonephila clavipes]
MRKGETWRPKQAKRAMETGQVNADLLHNHFWTDSATCSNPLLLFTDISVDGPTLSWAIPNVGSKCVTVRHFYSKHAPQKYNQDCRKQCLFCFGRKHWTYGQKNRPENVNHVMECLQRFVKDAKINEKRRKRRQRKRRRKCVGVATFNQCLVKCGVVAKTD